MPSVRVLLNYRPGEGRILCLLLVLFFLKGICDVFFATSASTLYLQSFSPVTLPYVYLASAAVVTLLGLAYSRLVQHYSTSTLLKATLLFVLATIGGLHTALAFGSSPWSAMGLMVWREVLYMLLNATFWAQVGLLFNVRQAKRLFALIAGGDIVSAAIGGAVIPLIVGRVGALHLLAFAELSMALCLVVSAAIDRAAPAPARPEDRADAPDTRPLTMLLKERYLALFFGVSIFSYVIYFFADYNFYAVVNDRFPDTTALASFFGVFYATLNAASLGLNGLVAGRLLTRYGVGAGLLAVPLLVGAGTLGALGLGSLGLTSLFFWAIIGSKLMDEMLRGAFLYPTYKIFYQPLPVRERLRVQAVRDSLIEPLGVGVSGLLLLALTTYGGFNVWQLCLVLLGVMAGFTTLSIALRKEYVNVLGRALRRRRMDDSSLLADAASIAVLRRGARSTNPTEAIYCLGLLETAQPAGILNHLLEALNHSEPNVRCHALRRLRELPAAAAAEPVNALIQREEIPIVLGEALWTLCQLTPDNAAECVVPYLDHEAPAVWRGALIGLLRNRSTAASSVAYRRLTALVQATEAPLRAAAAEILGHANATDFNEELYRLLSDDDAGVVRLALGAAGQVRAVSLLPAIIARLDDAEMKEAAADALVAFGDAAVPLLATELVKPRTWPDASRVVRILGRIATPSATHVLTAQINGASRNFRTTLLQALARSGFAAAGDNANTVRRALHAELQNAAWLLACRLDVSGNEKIALVSRALDHDVDEAKDRVLLLLSFLYPRQTVLNARTLFRHGSVDQRAQALEAVDNLLSRSMADAILPLLDELSPQEKLARLAPWFAAEKRSDIERLAEVIGAPTFGLSNWSRACAVYGSGQLAAASLRASVRAATANADALVRETARAVLDRFKPARAGVE